MNKRRFEKVINDRIDILDPNFDLTFRLNWEEFSVEKCDQIARRLITLLDFIEGEGEVPNEEREYDPEYDIPDEFFEVEESEDD